MATWSVSQVTHDINTMRLEINCPFNDHPTAWSIKQDLYRIKWLVDQALSQAPRFANESQWLNDQAQKTIWLKISS